MSMIKKVAFFDEKKSCMGVYANLSCTKCGNPLDLRFSKDGWKTYSFVGNKWQNIHKEIRKKYLINAYRVLLTRARQGMVMVIPEGNKEDPTRQPEFYDTTFNYLKSIGFKTV